MLRPSPNHGTQRLPNDDDDNELQIRMPEWNIVVVYRSRCLSGTLFLFTGSDA